MSAALSEFHDHAARPAGGTINQRQHLVLMMKAAPLLLALGLDGAVMADEGFVHLDDTATSAERGKVARAHRFADAMSEKPSRLVGDFQNAVELVSRHALLTGGHQIDRLEHYVQRNAGMLEHRSNLDRELLFAVAAAPQANPDTLRRIGRNLRDAVHAAAMRAGPAISPNDQLKMLESLGFIVEFRAGKN